LSRLSKTCHFIYPLVPAALRRLKVPLRSPELQISDIRIIIVHQKALITESPVSKSWPLMKMSENCSMSGTYQDWVSQLYKTIKFTQQ
jgi:hypothetical protein